MQIGAIVLAAGAATRMGRTKQLLRYHDGTLVEHAVRQAQMAAFLPVVVVVGAQAEAVSNAIEPTAAEIVLNLNWSSGMGSSIRAGVLKLMEIGHDLEGIAILLADQPLITSRHLEDMRHAFEQNNAPPAIAATYAGTVGVPAIFRRSVFKSLLELAPDAGARALLRGDKLQVQPFPLPEAATDIDTPDDFAAMQGSKLPA